jgi:hypothetical protein
MNFHDEIKKMQEQKITIKLQIDDNSAVIFTDIRNALEEMERQQKLQAALEKSHVAHLDGYNPHLN